MYNLLLLQMYLQYYLSSTTILRCVKTEGSRVAVNIDCFSDSCNENAISATYTAQSKLIRNRCYQHVIFKSWNDCVAIIQEIINSLDVLLINMLKAKNIYRHEQDSNLWGKIPLDFESNALTTRPSWPCIQFDRNSRIQIPSIISKKFG